MLSVTLGVDDNKAVHFCFVENCALYNKDVTSHFILDYSAYQ